MRRGKFKVRSRNSMGILVLIVFLALIPIIICLTELREQHFIFQMICESIKEKRKRTISSTLTNISRSHG